MKVAAALLGSAVGLGAANAEPWIAYTEENAPFNYEADGRVVGIASEIVSEIGRRAKVEFQLQMVPWSRGYLLGRQQANSCVYVTARLPEREELFHWIGPIAVNEWVLVGRSDFPGKVQSLQDAAKYRIGAPPETDGKTILLRSQGLTNLEVAADDRMNPAKLAAGRFDLWVTSRFKAKSLADANGITGLKTVGVVKAVEYYLACSKKSDSALIAEMQQMVQTLAKDGTIRRIHDRYAAKSHELSLP